MVFLLAWRNIWRNKRRTFITIGSISFAVFIAVIMQSMQKGSYARMVETSVGFYTGYLQVHQSGYWEEKILDNSMPYKKEDEIWLNEQSEIENVFPRIESFALASKGVSSRGVLVMGINPEKENRLTNISSKIIEGTFLTEEEEGAIISKGLSDYLKTGVGDTLVLIGQGYHSINAAGKFLIKAVVDIPSPELNKSTVYLSLSKAQWFYGAENLVSGYVIDLKDQNSVLEVQEKLKQHFGPEYEVLSWTEMTPDLVQSIELDYVSGMVMLMVLYMIISFGILGTFIMMTNERAYEFGVMMAIGTKKLKLLAITFSEILMLAFLSAIAGSILALPLVLYFHANPIVMTGETAAMYEKFGVEPILPFAVDVNIFFTHALVVFAVSILLALYPMVHISKLNIIKALKS